MIYCHIWESSLFLKTLKHITDLLIGQEYDWELDLPDMKKKEERKVLKISPFIKNSILKPLVDNGDDFGQLLKKAYSPNLRNSFAHSLYRIDMECRNIDLRIKKIDEDDCVKSEISFEDFQEKFLTSVYLCYFLRRAIYYKREEVAKKRGAITEPFKVPTGRMMQIFAEYREFDGKKYPSFTGCLITENVYRFKVGDLVKFEGIQTPIEVVEINDTKTEQLVKLKGAKKMCSSTMLKISSQKDEIDEECKDYQMIRLYLD